MGRKGNNKTLTINFHKERKDLIRNLEVALYDAMISEPSGDLLRRRELSEKAKEIVRVYTRILVGAPS